MRRHLELLTVAILGLTIAAYAWAQTYELVGKGLMLEHATLPDGSPVSTIVLNKVSLDG